MDIKDLAGNIYDFAVASSKVRYQNYESNHVRNRAFDVLPHQVGAARADVEASKAVGGVIELWDRDQFTAVFVAAYRGIENCSSAYRGIENWSSTVRQLVSEERNRRKDAQQKEHEQQIEKSFQSLVDTGDLKGWYRSTDCDGSGSTESLTLTFPSGRKLTLTANGVAETWSDGELSFNFDVA